MYQPIFNLVKDAFDSIPLAFNDTRMIFYYDTKYKIHVMGFANGITVFVHRINDIGDNEIEEIQIMGCIYTPNDSVDFITNDIMRVIKNDLA
jgi:hypothetical protein